MKDHDPKYLVERGYDCIAQRYLEGAKRNLASAEASARMGYLRKLLERLPAQAQVLELGCGAGVPCTQLLAQQADVTGVDISAAQVALAKQHVLHATLLQADMMTLAFPPASFDAVVAFYSIIHLPRAEQAVLVERLAEWLRPGGWFLVNLGVSNDPGSIEPDWLGAAMYWSSYDAQTNRDLVSRVGLTLVETEILIDDEDGEPVSFLWILAKRAFNKMMSF
jgi:cyclopropane fatty-acyl-phospholipid synthase-like methyltransferase